MTTQPLDFDGPTEHPFTQFPSAALERPVIDRFRAIADQYADHLAIDDGEQRFIYAELRQRVEHLARWLANHLPPDESPVALCFEHGAQFPLAVLAVLATGRAYLPLDLSFPEARNRRILTQAQIAALVTNRAHAQTAAELCPDGITPLCLDALDTRDGPPTLRDPRHALAPHTQRDALSARDQRAAGTSTDIGTGHSATPANTSTLPSPSADSLAYILYTSGSTGVPKGVYQNQRNLLHDVLQYTNAIHLDATDRLTMLYSASVNGAIRDIYGALLNGASLHPLAFRQLGTKQLAMRIAEQGITLYHSVPTVFRELISALDPRQHHLSRIRLAYLAGDRLERRGVDAFRRHFPADALLYTGIGSTENATLYRHWFIRPHTPLDGPTVPVGRAIPDRDMALLDENGTRVPVGEPGQIVVTSRYLALGYWRDPELTQQCFSPAPHDPQARVFSTGDLGVLRPDGLLEFRGRQDHQVKIRGYRVELGAIEATLKALPGIQDAAVVARASHPDQTRLDAYLVLDRSTHQGEPWGDLRQLRATLSDELPAHMIPATFTLLERLPLTANGKLERAALPLPESAPTGNEDQSIAPRNPTEQTLAQLWQAVLALSKPPGVHDNFFALGGHSLLMARLNIRIEAAFGIAIPLRTVFAGPTIATLAAWIDHQQWQASTPSEDTEREITLI